MKLRTHYILTKIAAEYSGLSFLERSAFCIGSLIPDLSPTQFIHPHFYARSAGYVQSRLESTANRGLLARLFEYGKMAHYASDFCCSVHSSGGVGNVREHILYERALNRYAKKNKELLKAEFKGLIKRQSLTAIVNDYRSDKSFDFYTDMLFAVKGCFSICERALCVDEPVEKIPLNGLYTT